MVLDMLALKTFYSSFNTFHFLTLNKYLVHIYLLIHLFIRAYLHPVFVMCLQVNNVNLSDFPQPGSFTLRTEGKD
jgi:hypothetical protein